MDAPPVADMLKTFENLMAPKPPPTPQPKTILVAGGTDGAALVSRVVRDILPHCCTAGIGLSLVKMILQQHADEYEVRPPS